MNNFPTTGREFDVLRSILPDLCKRFFDDSTWECPPGEKLTGLKLTVKWQPERSGTLVFLSWHGLNGKMLHYDAEFTAGEPEWRIRRFNDWMQQNGLMAPPETPNRPNHALRTAQIQAINKINQRRKELDQPLLEIPEDILAEELDYQKDTFFQELLAAYAEAGG
jgi:hypothetical protein